MNVEIAGSINDAGPARVRHVPREFTSTRGQRAFKNFNSFALVIRVIIFQYRNHKIVYLRHR